YLPSHTTSQQYNDILLALHSIPTRRSSDLLMGLDRPAKRNAFNLAMIDQLAAAYHELEAADDVRCGVLFAHGEHFTGGLDLAEVDRKSTRLNSSHLVISYAVFCLKK